MLAFSKATQSNKDLAAICDAESWKRYKLLGEGKQIDLGKPKDLERLRSYLLDFIADAASWEASTNRVILDTARFLTQSAHESLGGEKGTRPLVIDPFAGGGAIPLEAVRVGADAFASDLNPVAVLLNKVVLDYIPKYGQKLADEVQKWGRWVMEEAEKELAQFYPKDADGSTPIAYLWARTIQCEGPSCGVEVPLMRSLWLAKKGTRSSALKLVPNAKDKRIDFEIVQDVKSKDVGEGTVRRGAVTCPRCGYTTAVASVRAQFKRSRGGTHSARLAAVATLNSRGSGRQYRVATEVDLEAIASCGRRLQALNQETIHGVPILPHESTKGYHTFVNRGSIYGLSTWSDYFGQRQLLCLHVFAAKVREVSVKVGEKEMGEAVQTCLALIHSKAADLANSLCRWEPVAECPRQLFARQAIPFTWDFAEGVLIGKSSGSWSILIDRFDHVLRSIGNDWRIAVPHQASATAHPLPDDSASALITDPPYYFSVQYADLSDFFYVWLKRSLPPSTRASFTGECTPKDDEIIVQSPGDAEAKTGKNRIFYEKRMQAALAEARRVVRPDGVGVIVFAHTSTAGWEAMLQATISAGWTITGSWPIDTEMASRVIAQNRAVLASSVHIVCRPREDADGSLRENDVGDWRDILAELPSRTREWMARLSSEGVVGADAIFACLGPALEIFSRYSRVEKASGEPVLLKEYLTYVWGTVAQEALTQIFQGADATGFEEDARLTAMWLWTLNAGGIVQTAVAEVLPDPEDAGSADEAGDDDEDGGDVKAKGGGYVLEFDAARKIAQGLGAHLEEMSDVVEVKSDKARLLGVGERTRKLFGKDEADAPKPKGKKKDKQLTLGFAQELEAAEAEGNWGDKSVPKLGDTVLDRIHQSMILFAAGRGEALRRFLVEDGAGQDQRFWKLANALSALYPQSTDEKRWVDGVLARKKGLGL